MQAPQHFLNVDRIGPAPDRELLFIVRHALLSRRSALPLFIAEFLQKCAGATGSVEQKKSGPAT
jgi:hypothetical protein